MAREMKDSGVEWIGQIPKEWKVIKLKKIMTFLNGYAFEGKYPVIRIGDIFNNKIDIKNSNKINLINDEEKFLEKFLIKQNDILIAMSGATVGKLAFIDDIKEKVYINQRVGILRSNMNKYLFYSLANNMFLKYIYLLSIGSAQPNISSVGIENYIIAISSLEEQEKIANYLDKKVADIDLIIEKTKTTIEDYKKYKQSIVTEAVTKGLNPDVEMKDSGIEWIGQIPKHWKIRKLRFIGTCQNGISKSAEYFGKGFPFVSYGDVYKNYELPLPTNLVESTEKDRELYSVKYGDIFFTRTSETIEEIGFTSTCLKFIENAVFAGFIIRFRPFTLNELYPNFSKYYFRSNIHRKYFVKEMNLVTRASLSQELLKKLPVILPSLEEQKEIAEYLDKKVAEIDNLIAKKESLISEMEEYKKSLIYECVTGKKEIGLSENKIIPFIPKTKNLQFAKAVLIAKIADELNGKKGKVAIAKILYLIEIHLPIEFNSIIERQVAGPLDSEFYKAESILKKDKWFKIKKWNYLETYTADEKKDDYKKYYVKYFGQINDKIEDIIDKLKNLSTEKLEMIATMYASINDFKIKNQELDKDKIIEDIFSWNESKERFSKEKWLEVFETLNNLDLIPNGYGKSTIKK